MDRKPGDKLGNGRFELLSELGQGAYGTVWKAKDENLEIEVAIKFLQPGMGMISDLKNEAVIQSKLSHENIAKVLDFNIDERYMAMEYIDGKSLDKNLLKKIHDSTWFSIDESTNILRQCFFALMKAHEHAVIHGDIKPGNIMLTKDNKVKLTDFGVAKTLQETGCASYTGISARRLGSISYAAPEILLGEPRTFVSDIFSLGIVAYLLYVKIHPFYSTHPSGLFQIKDLVCSEDHEIKSLRSVNPEIPETYDKVILKMLSRSINQRYKTIREAYEEFSDVGIKCKICNFNNPLVSGANYCLNCGKSLALNDKFEGRSANDLQTAAYTLNSKGQFSMAIEFCKEAIRMDPNFSDAYRTIGFAYSSMADYEQSLQAYKKALELSTDKFTMGQIHRSISYIYDRLLDMDAAKEHLQLALEYNPNDMKARNLLNKLYNQYD